MSLPSGSGIVSEVVQFYKIYQVLLNYTHTKISEFSNVLTFEKSIFYPLVLKNHYRNNKTLIIHKLSIIYYVLITRPVCKSQILKRSTFLIFFRKKTRILQFP